MTTQATLTPATLDALVRLLADDDARIRGIAREKLAEAGDRALDVLRDRALCAEDLRVRAAAEEFLREARRTEVLRLWGAMARASEPDLESGALLIARSEYPDLDAAPYHGALDEYARVLGRRLGAIRSPAEVFERLNTLLFKDLGYKGNRERYHDPENSYINRVMDRKLGIPISLSAVYVLVARRLEQKIEGVGLPGHFLLRYRAGRHEVFLDPFNQGREWSLQDCRAHLLAEGFSFQEEFFRAVSDREILLRMLENLLRIYHTAGDQPRMERVTRMQESLRGK
jgi:regulator of sirC expression with transglutaminase-like and TPR domain